MLEDRKKFKLQKNKSKDFAVDFVGFVPTDSGKETTAGTTGEESPPIKEPELSKYKSSPVKPARKRP